MKKSNIWGLSGITLLIAAVLCIVHADELAEDEEMTRDPR